MTQRKMAEIIASLQLEETELMSGKCAAYSEAGDVLSNFKIVAEMCGVSKYQVWLVYFEKHALAIANAIRNTPEAPDEKTEGMRGRILDARGYLAILAALLDEDAEPETKPMPRIDCIGPKKCGVRRSLRGIEDENYCPYYRYHTNSCTWEARNV